MSLPFTPEELWPYVSDTDRLDKAVGLPAAHFERGEVGRDEPDVGEYRVLGVRIARWVEHPFEWERPRHFAVVREYTSGPVARFYGGTELLPEGGSTTVRVFAEFLPRSPLFAPLFSKLIGPLSIKRSCRQFEAIGQFLARRSPQPFPALIQSRTPANTARLDELLQRLRADGVAEPQVELLRHVLAEAADEDVAGMRPLQLAEQNRQDGPATLAAFLQATVAGLVEMQWELLCPGCHGVKAQSQHLGDLEASGHCEACNLDFRPDVDELIEARFYPSPAIRRVEVGTYCVSGPGKTLQRLMQGLLEPGETRTFHVEMAAGSCILRSPQTRGVTLLTTADATGETSLEATLESTTIAPDQASLRTGEVSFRLSNATSRRLTVTLDTSHTPVGAATPSRLMSIPIFQSLFSAEALAPGVELQVSRVGLLFSDLTGSTALYERVGDARAFRLVTDHFTVLRQAIEQAGGAVVKTIGDAIMAAFPDARSAVAAAVRIQQRICDLDTRGLVDPTRLVKIGIHSGACFAVTQNDRLDYFGTTVNVAARAQHEAKGGEIVLTEAAYSEVKDVLGDETANIERFTVQLRGITDPVPLIRIPAA